MINLDALAPKKLEVGAHEVTIKEYESITNDKGGYLKVVFQKEDGREIQHTVFPKSLDYHISCLQKQLELEDQDCTIKQVLDFATENPFKIYVSYSVQYGRNIALHDVNDKAEEVDPESVSI